MKIERGYAVADRTLAVELASEKMPYSAVQKAMDQRQICCIIKLVAATHTKQPHFCIINIAVASQIERARHAARLHVRAATYERSFVLPTLFSTLPGTPKRVRRKCPSPQFATREEAVAASKPGRFGVDKAITKKRKAPHAYGHIFRDAIDALIPERLLLLSGFVGTYYYSKRDMFRRATQQLHLKQLGIEVGADGTISPIEAERAKLLYPAVAHLVTEQGDLRKPAQFETIPKRAPKAGKKLVRRGCFGVPFWKAMQPRCHAHDCLFVRDCEAVIDYRLTFGGRENYERTYSPDWSFDVRERARQLFDEKSNWKYNQHFQRMRLDPDVQRLLSVYTGLWYLSDLAAGARVQDAKWDDHAPFREESARLAAEAAAEEAAAVAAHLADFRSSAETLIKSSLDAGDLARIDLSLRTFFDGNKERKWRKPAKAIEALSAVELARMCVRKVVSASPTFKSRATKKAIADLANLVRELAMGVSGPTIKIDALSYNAVDRHLATLSAIRGTGIALLPATAAAKVDPEPDLA